MPGRAGRRWTRRERCPMRGQAAPCPSPASRQQARGRPAEPAAAQDPAPADGRLIGGRSRLAAALGQGSTGTVWHARDEFLRRDVAIKEIRLPPGLSDAEQDHLRQRMLREARGAARLSHPAVATVHDVAEDLGRPWIVMELLHGRPLDRVIADDGPLPPATAARIGQPLLAALTAAHAAGVLHRDVKPGNVMLADDGNAVLADFGLAAIDGDPSLTQTGTVVGTPAFTAPGRIRGETATPASDLWSLGTTLYAAVKGKGPYDHHRGVIATIAAIATDDPPPPKTAGPLTGAITALLSRDPAARPSAAAATLMLNEAADTPAAAPGPPHPRPRTPARAAGATRGMRRWQHWPASPSRSPSPSGRCRTPQHRTPQRCRDPCQIIQPSRPPRPGLANRSGARHHLRPAQADCTCHQITTRRRITPVPAPRRHRSRRGAASDLALRRPVHHDSLCPGLPAGKCDRREHQHPTWEGARGVSSQSVTVDLGSVTDIARIVLALPPLADWNSRVQTLALYGSRTSATSTFTIVPALATPSTRQPTTTKSRSASHQRTPATSRCTSPPTAAGPPPSSPPKSSSTHEDTSAPGRPE